MCWFKEQIRELYINFVSPRTRSLHLTSLNVFQEETGVITSKNPDLSVGVKFSGFSYGFQHFDLYPAHIAIEQWGFFSVPHLLWHGTSIIMVIFEDPWHSHLLPSILQWLSQPILPTSVCRGWVSNNHPSACGATVLTDCATATENPVLINSKTLEDALVFTYLGSKILQMKTDKDTNTRFSRANQSFAIWSPSPVMVTSSYEWKIL